MNSFSYLGVAITAIPNMTEGTEKKAESPLQEIFGKDFQNTQIITSRPENMSYPEYKRLRAEQKRIIKMHSK